MDWKKWMVRASLGLLAATILLVIIANNTPQKAKRPQVNFTINMKTDTVSNDAVAQALTAFAHSCAPLTTKYWHNVLWAKATVSPVEDYQQYLLDKGWKHHIELEIALSDKTDIPVSEAYGVSDGHHLWYELGGGTSPGFFATKRVSQELCGMRAESGKSVFRELAEMKVLP